MKLLAVPDRAGLMRALTLAFAAAALLMLGLRIQDFAHGIQRHAFEPDAGQLVRFAVFIAADSALALLGLVIGVVVHERGRLFGGLYLAAMAVAQTLPPAIGAQDAQVRRLVAMAIVAIGLGSAVRFAQSFPRAVLRSDLPASRVGNVLRLLLQPRITWCIVIGACALHAIRPGTIVLSLLNLFVAATALTFIRLNYRNAESAERRRIYWVMQAVLVMSIAVVVHLALQLAGVRYWFVAMAVGQLAMALSAAFAMFYHGALDPRLVVKRTAALSAAAGLVVLIFIAMETAITNLLIDRMQTDSSTVQIGAGVVSALCARPIHKWVERVLQRRLPTLAR